jgi:hypothetical protein
MENHSENSNHWEYKTIADDEDIDYNSLPDEALKAFALGNDLFMANSALAELAMRENNLAEIVADEILTKQLGDQYLQVAALEILFNKNKTKALKQASSLIPHADLYFVNKTIELWLDNPAKISEKTFNLLYFPTLERLKDFGENEKITSNLLSKWLLTLENKFTH